MPSTRYSCLVLPSSWRTRNPRLLRLDHPGLPPVDLAGDIRSRISPASPSFFRWRRKSLLFPLGNHASGFLSGLIRLLRLPFGVFMAYAANEARQVETYDYRTYEPIILPFGKNTASIGDSQVEMLLGFTMRPLPVHDHVLGHVGFTHYSRLQWHFTVDGISRA